ncbi:hypothetical protein PVK06_041161 [Gossypium arboreum]|uniref:Uncharacterized protein n=1 Tax=Gossypium arboreum TaxID=29729 RepID=A0ABR0NAA2_GOSAR|nr:hypothetical protein PVK06_041161 [Gossypium arboreum]
MLLMHKTRLLKARKRKRNSMIHWTVRESRILMTRGTVYKVVHCCIRHAKVGTV